MIAWTGVALPQERNFPTVGLLWVRSPENSRVLDGLVEGLRIRGYVRGKNIDLDDRYLVDRYDDLPAAAEKLARERHAVLFCFGATATLTMARATSTLPIVTVSALDPVRTGVAVSLARPGKNLTGLVAEADPLGPKRLEILKEVVPELRRAGVIYAPQSPLQADLLDRMREVAGKLKVQVEAIPIRSPEELKSLSARIKSARVDGVLVTGSLFSAHRSELVRQIEASRLPAMFADSVAVAGGGLLSYGPSSEMRFHKGAEFVDRILKGAKAGDIPIEQDTRYYLVINLKTAKALGVTIPPSILVRADRVIE